MYTPDRSTSAAAVTSTTEAQVATGVARMPATRTTTPLIQGVPERRPAPPPSVPRQIRQADPDHPAGGARRRAVAGVTGGGLVALLAAGHAAVDTVTSAFAALLPSLQVRFGLTETVLALLVATLAFSSSVSQPLLGALADRLGRRPLAAAGAVLTAALVSLVGVAPTAALLFALLLVGGLGSAALHPAGASMVRGAGMRNPGLAVSLFSAAGTAGVALGPVAALSLVGAAGLGATPWLMVPGVTLGLLMAVALPAQARCRAPGACPRLFDRRLFAGPVGLLTLSEVATGLAQVTFTGAVPLWLVTARGTAPDAPLIGWTLGAFSLSGALGGLAGAALGGRADRRLLVTGTMLLAPLPLLAVLRLEPGTAPFFLAVALGGALLNAGFPLKVVSAQDLAPHSLAAASGMLMGFATDAAGLVYVGVGRLQETAGLAQAAGAAYLLLVPGALLALFVLTRYRAAAPEGATPEMRAARREAAAVAAAAVGERRLGAPCVCTAACVCPTATASGQRWGRHTSCRRGAGTSAETPAPTAGMRGAARWRPCRATAEGQPREGRETTMAVVASNTIGRAPASGSAGRLT